MRRLLPLLLITSGCAHYVPPASTVIATATEIKPSVAHDSVESYGAEGDDVEIQTSAPPDRYPQEAPARREPARGRPANRTSAAEIPPGMSIQIQLPDALLTVSCQAAPPGEPLPCKKEKEEEKPKTLWEIIGEFAKPIAAALGGAVAALVSSRLVKKRKGRK